MRRPHLLLRVLFFSGWIASWSPTDAAGPADAHLFPAPHRPVATIISPAYSDEETRDRRGEAERVMDRVGIRPGMRVADIGSGDGYYTVRLARRLGRAATIYAEDVKAEYLGRLASRLKREGISSVTLIHGLLKSLNAYFEIDEVDGGTKIHHVEEMEMAFGPFGKVLELSAKKWLADSVRQEVAEIKRLLEAGERGKGP